MPWSQSRGVIARCVYQFRDVIDIAKDNPQVDVDKLRRARDLLEKLKDAGIARREYNIASPYQRRPVALDP